MADLPVSDLQFYEAEILPLIVAIRTRCTARNIPFVSLIDLPDQAVDAGPTYELLQLAMGVNLPTDYQGVLRSIYSLMIVLGSQPSASDLVNVARLSLQTEARLKSGAANVRYN